MASNSLEGDGKVKINFVAYETLLKYKDVGIKIAKQICAARVAAANKLKKRQI